MEDSQEQSNLCIKAYMPGFYYMQKLHQTYMQLSEVFVVREMVSVLGFNGFIDYGT